MLFSLINHRNKLICSVVRIGKLVIHTVVLIFRKSRQQKARDRHERHLRSRLKEKRARSAGRLSAMPEGDEYVEVDGKQEAIPMQALSDVRVGTTASSWQKGEDGYDSYSYPNADPGETQTIYVGQYADPNAAINSEYRYSSEAPQESVSEKKYALLRNEHCTVVCNW